MTRELRAAPTTGSPKRTVAAMLASTGFVALAFSGPASAQTETAAATGLGDIVVTAQKRAQNLQDVPIAVTAISQETLQANRVTNVGDISGLAPNMIIRPSGGGGNLPTFSMRGVLSYGVVPGSDKQVSLYLDGVYISAARGSMFELPDIERLEVLRGPQGTLFGRNSTAGAVSIVTRDPTGEFGLRQELTLGNYDQFRTRTTVDLPAIGPFSAYVSFLHNERQGDVRNLGAGTIWDRTGPNTDTGVVRSPQRLGDRNVDSWFAAVRFEPSDNFRATYKFDHAINHYTPEANTPIGVIPGRNPLLDVLLATQPATGPYGPVVFEPSGKRPKEVNNFWTGPAYQRNSGHNLTAELDLGNNLTLRNIFAYREAYVNLSSEIGGIGGLVVTPAAAALIPTLASQVGKRFLTVGTNVQHDSKQWSNELQLNYNSEWLTLTAGALWFRAEDRAGGPRGIRNTFQFGYFPATGAVPLGIDPVVAPTGQGVSYNKLTSLAAYGQAEVNVTDQIQLVGGIRVTNDKKSGYFESGGILVPDAPGSRQGQITGLVQAPFDYEETKPTFLVGANFKPSEDILLYAKYSTGFVSGGSVAGVPFDVESVKSWEAGLKADFLDNRVRTNLALFWAKYQDLQSAQSGRNVQRPELGTVVVTQGDAEAKGFEIEATVLPATGLTLGGSLGYTDVEFGPVNPMLLISVTEGPPGSLASQYLPTGIPEWTSNLWAQYETPPILGDASMMFRVDGIWRSALQHDPNPLRTEGTILDVAARSPASWVVNARAALRGMRMGRMETEFALWVRNLNDNKEALFPLSIGASIATSHQPARTWGADLIFRF